MSQPDKCNATAQVKLAVALLQDRDRLRAEGKAMPSNETFCRMLLDQLASEMISSKPIDYEGVRRNVEQIQLSMASKVAALAANPPSMIPDSSARAVKDAFLEGAQYQTIKASSALSETERMIRCVWVVERAFGYGKAMRVVASDHPRFSVGTRFNFGFLDIAVTEGYRVQIDPVPPHVKHDMEEDRRERQA